jgi:hypothetical protein
MRYRRPTAEWRGEEGTSVMLFLSPQRWELVRVRVRAQYKTRNTGRANLLPSGAETPARDDSGTDG